MLRWQDVSTGQIVAEARTRLGPVLALRQNPTNAILHAGHANGTVTLWSPNLSTPHVKMLTHRGPVAAVAIDRTGVHMATAGLDGQVKLWDLRTYRALEAYYTPAAPTALAISQMGLLAVTFGASVHVWQDAFRTKQKTPYMHHMIPGAILHAAAFCPHDDTLGLGHNRGVASILIPGAGDPHFDSFEANPFETTKQRREGEVKGLLNKIQPDMIDLNTDHLGTLKEDHAVVLEWHRAVARDARPERADDAPAEKTDDAPAKKPRSKSSTLRRYLKKQDNVVDARKEAVRARRDEEKRRRVAPSSAKPTLMDRFKRPVA
jgi:U3 small nucleolar RNA-associated protein 7